MNEVARSEFPAPRQSADAHDALEEVTQQLRLVEPVSLPVEGQFVDTTPLVDRFNRATADNIHLLQASSYSGPIPPPQMLREFNQIEPGLARQIVEMAEREQAHRHTMDIKQHEADMQRAKHHFSLLRSGQILAFSISVVVMAAAVLLGYQGHEVGGTILGTLDVVALAGVFLAARYHSRSEPGSERAEQSDEAK